MFLFRCDIFHMAMVLTHQPQLGIVVVSYFDNSSVGVVWPRG